MNAALDLSDEPLTAVETPPSETHAREASLALPMAPKPERAAVAAADKPWRRVTTNDVDRAIQGTALEPVVRYLQTPTDPPLPLEGVLGKALAISGSLLAKPRADYDPAEDSGERGCDLAKFRILTGGGQVTNIWSLCVGASGSGKDIGGLAVRLVSAYSNYVGSSGSASGLCEAYMALGAGLLSVSEFEPYLDPRAWQSMARTMLTNAFSEGHFDVRLSGRSGKRRVSRYCYPSIVANIQPGVLRRYAGSIHVDSGFLPRFLISALPCRRWRPSSGCSDMRPAIEALAVYERLAGDVTPEANYLADLDAMFAEHEAIPGVFRRYVNEYGPRIACILQADGRAIRPETWNRTRTILQWYYAQAETVIELVRDDGARNPFETQLVSMLGYIRRKTPDGGVTKTTISRNKGEGTTAHRRDQLLEELMERGWVVLNSDGRYAATGAGPG